MHVGDLDGNGVAASRSRWNASVTITVHDQDEVLLAGVTVSGSWSGGVSGNASCTTGESGQSGQCTVTVTGIKSNASSVTFTVAGLTYGSFNYEPANNHDPDGDSDGTAITVLQP